MAHESTNQHFVVRLLNPVGGQQAGRSGNGLEARNRGELFSQLGKAGMRIRELYQSQESWSDMGGRKAERENGQDCGIHLLPHSAL